MAELWLELIYCFFISKEIHLFNSHADVIDGVRNARSYLRTDKITSSRVFPVHPYN